MIELLFPGMTECEAKGRQVGVSWGGGKGWKEGGDEEDGKRLKKGGREPDTGEEKECNERIKESGTKTKALLINRKDKKEARKRIETGFKNKRSNKKMI